MQNRPNYAVQFLQLPLDAEFPLYIHDHLRHPSQAIDHLHRHDCMELGLCLEGEGVFVVESKIMNFRSGDFSVIGPSEAHLATSSPGTTSHWVWFYLDFERLLLPHFPNLDLSALSTLRGSRFRNIHDGTRDPRGGRLLADLFHAEEKEERCALLLLLALHLRKETGVFPGQPLPSPETGNFQRVAPAIAYFSRHYAETASIPAAARLCHMSVTNFRRIFKCATGTSPLDYLNNLRISMARAELRSGKYRISEVAVRCGFPSLSSFNRQFRKQLGSTPRAFCRNK